MDAHYESEREAAWTVYRAQQGLAGHVSLEVDRLLREAFLAGWDSASGEVEADLFGEAA
jgi:hypothetical protein